jgi:hypothetical protein
MTDTRLWASLLEIIEFKAVTKPFPPLTGKIIMTGGIMPSGDDYTERKWKIELK